MLKEMFRSYVVRDIVNNGDAHGSQLSSINLVTVRSTQFELITVNKTQRTAVVMAFDTISN